MSSGERIRVMVVDDHSIMRVGLKQVLEQSGESGGEGDQACVRSQHRLWHPGEAQSRFDAGSGALGRAEWIAGRLAAATVKTLRRQLLDLMLPGSEGIELTKDILDIAPAPVIFLSAYGQVLTFKVLLERVWGPGPL